MNKKILLILTLSFLLPLFSIGKIEAGSLNTASTVDKSYYGADNDEEANGNGHEEDESSSSGTNVIFVVIGSIAGVGIIGGLIYVAKKKSSS